jgi:hypothetical protein
MPACLRKVLSALFAIAAAPGAYAANLVLNPDFDEGLAHWTNQYANGSVVINSGDGSPATPSLSITAFGPIVRMVSDCMALPAGPVDLYVRARLITSGYAHAFVNFYSAADCSGTSYISDQNVVEWRPADSGTEWAERSLLNYPAPAGAVAAQVYLRADRTGGNADGTALFDRLRFGPAGTTPVALQAFSVD